MLRALLPPQASYQSCFMLGFRGLGSRVASTQCRFQGFRVPFFHSLPLLIKGAKLRCLAVTVLCTAFMAIEKGLTFDSFDVRPLGDF